jgi:hypothetical protein
MDLLKNAKRFFTKNNVIAIVAFIFVVYIVCQYSGNKGGIIDSMDNGNALGSAAQPPQNAMSAKKQAQQPQQPTQFGAGVNYVPAQPLGQNGGFKDVTGVIKSAGLDGLPPTCTRKSVTNPSELLPKDKNSEWAKLNPVGGGDLKDINLLKAGYHIGIDTIGQSLRNANLQVRSEPPNPTRAVSPWMNTTIEPDLTRVPLELGCGPQ